MKNKILIELLVPEIEESYSIYIPISRRVGDIIQLLLKSISDFCGAEYERKTSIALYNARTGYKYGSNDLIYDTDIRNGTKLVLI